MKEIDHTLCGSHRAAIMLIETAYDKACELYGGKASVPELKSFVSSHNTAVFYVPEVVYVEVYEVEKEFNFNIFLP